MDNIFFCYSKKLHKFLDSLNFQYNQHNTNKISGNEYWSYERTEILNEALKEWENLKNKFNPYKESKKM